jgi:arylformamidase
MEIDKQIIDITLPIYNDMWCYRPEWSNSITTVSATANGDASTVYHFGIHSHTGTYIETSQHKLNNKLLLHDFGLESFYGDCFVVVISRLEDNVVTHASFLKALNGIEWSNLKGSKLIIATGYGIHHTDQEYLKNAPSFEPSLTQALIALDLSLLGVDTPIIENQKQPYQPVTKLFEANEKLLLLAPLEIDTQKVETGWYILSCLPSFKCDISGSPTRAILIRK